MRVKQFMAVKLTITASLLLSSAYVLSTTNNSEKSELKYPAQEFDLQQWSLNPPTDVDGDGIVDDVSVKALQEYHHEKFFYLDEDQNMVFAAPNKAVTSVNSTNTRSELHQRLSGVEAGSFYTDNFSIAANPESEKYPQVGGYMEATLKVDHVPRRAKYTEKPTAYSVVIGQVHAVQDETMQKKGQGYGWGNEPLKIYYKKHPEHEYGSVFWNYERNLVKNDSNRIDISYSVWGEPWLSKQEPGKDGIALNEPFSYKVNIHENIMYLTFTSDRLGSINYQIDLANNVDALGEIDIYDHPAGYTGEAFHFKAGAYNQCSTKDALSFRYPACPGSGDWQTDKSMGDYTQVTFMQLLTDKAREPQSH
ncbi:polysaccharide lyase family 7 protein [Gilvimarinus agarilyticus]|uniref:polysaccharide lyase family 7 protein n=1 Tax=Gilvimarinus sp. 2_MG-2023 TaxID=3062666 RepID=UPI001C08C393|nr:polysaccharide lyase family 7 protein [Gilvimarinus sp. 2_MG-2023]MBU2886217.1 polysaccharide lyase family 7 protein [Gilvimarinus agarilyticus]MDO6570905.1 polysaccharide lyase family 7 protein [Gilvimarinus sp. 2_MG-2023]